MPSTQTFQKGDILIEYGQAHQVFQVKERPNIAGEEEPHVYYKPIFTTEKNETIVCSIPQSSIPQTNKRKPLTKKNLKKLFQILETTKKNKKKVNTNSGKATLKNNDALETAELVAQLWYDKEDEDRTFPYSKKRLYRNATRHVAQEIAVVKDITPRQAKSLIRQSLKKLTA